MTINLIAFASLYPSPSARRKIPSTLLEIATPGHVALEFDQNTILGFAPDPLPDKVELDQTYSGYFGDHTQIFEKLERIIPIHRFPLKVGQHEEYQIQQKFAHNPSPPDKALAPLQGPPYNCISYLRNVLDINLPETNLLILFLDEMKKRNSPTSSYSSQPV